MTFTAICIGVFLILSLFAALAFWAMVYGANRGLFGDGECDE